MRPFDIGREQDTEYLVQRRGVQPEWSGDGRELFCLTSDGVPPVRHEVTAQPGRPQTREGFWFNVGMGIGSLGCEDCVGREDGLSGGLSLGGRITDRLLMGVGTTGWAKQLEGETFTVGTLSSVSPSVEAGIMHRCTPTWPPSRA